MLALPVTHTRRQTPVRLGILALIAGLVAGVGTLPAERRVEVLQSVGSLPPEVVGAYREPAGFQQVQSGQYLVFDRRSHAVFGVDAEKTGTWKLVDIGQEEGRLLDPSAFDAEPGGSFVVADAPDNIERVQIFAVTGRKLGGFTLPGRSSARVTLGNIVVSGVGSLQYTGSALLMSQPETGALMTEYGLGGTPTRTFGTLRPTGQEQDRAVHLALNSGLPLINPLGGYYFVFQAGVPMFRKYDASGRLLFERHIEGPEIDPVVMSLPTVWPRRPGRGGDLPLVVPSVRTAAVDASGNLWIALVQPVTYVYDPTGEKSRVVAFRGAGVIAPVSLSFTGKNRLLVTPGCYEFVTAQGTR